jgi:hypothetical protein
MGDLLFSIANLSRKLGIEPESALRKANAKFSGRFEAVERAFEKRGQSIQDATLEEMEAEWANAKNQGREDRLNEPRQSAKKRRNEETKKKRRPLVRVAGRQTAGRAPAGGRRRK